MKFLFHSCVVYVGVFSSELKKYYFFINSNYSGGFFFSYFFNIFQKQSKVWIKEIGEVEENGWMSLICPKGRKILNKNRKCIFQHLVQSKKSHQPDCHEPQSLKIPAVSDGFSLGTTVMLTVMVLS